MLIDRYYLYLCIDIIYVEILHVVCLYVVTLYLHIDTMYTHNGGLMSVDLRERINKYPLPAMAGFIG